MRRVSAERFPLVIIFSALVFSIAAPIAERSEAATILIETPGPLSRSTVRPRATSLGLVAPVDVGVSDVEIIGIGIFGEALATVDVKWLVFSNTTDSAPLFESAVVSVSAGSVQWHDSPEFAPFTLQANETYWIGMVIDDLPVETFNFQYNNGLEATIVSENGLSLRGAENGNVRNSFANPIGDLSGFAQPGIRLFSAPEPSTALLLGLGLVGLASTRRRRTAA